VSYTVFHINIIMRVPWDGTDINCYVMGQTNMSHWQSCKNTYSTPSKCCTTRFLQEATQHQNRWPLMQAVITMHEKFLKVYLPVAPDGVLTNGKSKFALKYSKGKGMPSGFSHFYCHRVVLSTQKNFKRFFNISRRPVAARWSPAAKNIVSGPLVQPQRPAQNPDH